MTSAAQPSREIRCRARQSQRWRPPRRTGTVGIRDSGVHPDRGQPHARGGTSFGRAGVRRIQGRACEMRGGRFRHIAGAVRDSHDQAGVIRANAARYPISATDAGYRSVPPLPTCYCDRPVRSRGRESCGNASPDDVSRGPASTASEATTAPGSIKAALEHGGASPRPGDASAASCANRALTGVVTRADGAEPHMDAGSIRGRAREPMPGSAAGFSTATPRTRVRRATRRT